MTTSAAMSTTPHAARRLDECTVVVTPRSFGIDDPSLRQELESQVGKVVYVPGPLNAAELSEVVRDAHGLIAGLDEVNADVLAVAKRLKVVARYGVGTDRVDLVAAHARGVIVTVTPGANANAVAEFTIGLLFALARHLCAAREAARSPRWPPFRGVELSGRALGLVGLGRIGTRVAAKAQALGMQVIAYDPFVESSPDCRLANLQAVLSSAEFVSLHAPLTPETRGMIGREQLQLMRPGSSLVNTARGALVDEGALLWALEEGPLRAAALDVLNEEPPSPGSVGRALLDREDVIVTPHIGPHTAEATTAMGRMAVAELLAVLSGRKPHSAVSLGQGER